MFSTFVYAMLSFSSFLLFIFFLLTMGACSATPTRSPLEQDHTRGGKHDDAETFIDLAYLERHGFYFSDVPQSHLFRLSRADRHTLADFVQNHPETQRQGTAPLWDLHLGNGTSLNAETRRILSPLPPHIKNAVQEDLFTIRQQLLFVISRDIGNRFPRILEGLELHFQLRYEAGRREMIQEIALQREENDRKAGYPADEFHGDIENYLRMFAYVLGSATRFFSMEHVDDDLWRDWVSSGGHMDNLEEFTEDAEMGVVSAREDQWAFFYGGQRTELFETRSIVRKPGAHAIPLPVPPSDSMEERLLLIVTATLPSSSRIHCTTHL